MSINFAMQLFWFFLQAHGYALQFSILKGVGHFFKVPERQMEITVSTKPNKTQKNFLPESNSFFAEMHFFRGPLLLIYCKKCFHKNFTLQYDQK